MDGREKLDRPRSVEDLSQRERIKRLHHQLSLIYDKVFLTGDWSADYEHPKETEAVRTNIFEDSVVTDPSVLAESLKEFIQNVAPTIQKSPNRETRTSLREFNRKLFLEVLESIHAILSQSAKEIRTIKELEMEKSVDENIHSFRDIPIVYSKEIPTIREKDMPPDPAGEEDTIHVALQTILGRLTSLTK